MATGTAADAVAFARAQIDKPYVWATAGPNSFDCSGLCYAAYQSIGVNIGRTTYEQIFNGSEVAQSDLVEGDLVFPYADLSHVQIYSGGGNVIESPHSGAVVHETAIYAFARARRIIGSGSNTTAVGIGVTPAGPFGPGGPFTPLSELTQNALNNINPLKGIDKLAEAFVPAYVAGKVLTSGTFWVRAMYILMGLFFTVTGIFFLVEPARKRITRSILGGGSQVAQGAAFGAGLRAVEKRGARGAFTGSAGVDKGLGLGAASTPRALPAGSGTRPPIRVNAKTGNVAARPSTRALSFSEARKPSHGQRSSFANDRTAQLMFGNRIPVRQKPNPFHVHPTKVSKGGKVI